MSDASNGWRACIDHIIRPDSPCPVCEIERLTAKIDELDVWDEGQEKKIERLQARVEELERSIEIRDDGARRQKAKVEALERVAKEHRWLRSKARVESRDFETPPYAWTIRFRSTCSTVENAIRNAIATEQDN